MSSLELSIVWRLLLAVCLGGIIGVERERAHKVAGLRTHALVAMGSTLLTIVAMHGFQYFGENSGDAASRVIANIIVGIGFIGAGAILRREDHVIGTTTAATLWLVAGIGIAVGLNFLFAAVIAALFGYIILTAFLDFELRVLDDSTKKSHGKKVLNSDEADR